MKVNRWLFTVLLIALAGVPLQGDSIIPAKIDELVSAVSNTSSHLGYEYAKLVTLFERNPVGAKEACRLLPNLDRIRRDAHYTFESIEAQAEMKIVRTACK